MEYIEEFIEDNIKIIVITFIVLFVVLALYFIFREKKTYEIVRNLQEWKLHYKDF